MNIQNFSTVPVFQFFSRKCKSVSFQFCIRVFWFLWECIVYLLKRNVQSRKCHHVVWFQSKIRLFSSKSTIWKQKSYVLAPEKELQLIIVITLPVISHFFCNGFVESCPCHCVQQKFENTVTYEAGTSKLSNSKSLTYKIHSLKKEIRSFICQSRLYSRQKFVLST